MSRIFGLFVLIVLLGLPAAARAQKGVAIADTATVNPQMDAMAKVFGPLATGNGGGPMPEVTFKFSSEFKWQMRKRPNERYGRLLEDEKTQFLCGRPFDCEDFIWDPSKKKVLCTSCPAYTVDESDQLKCTVAKTVIPLESADLRNKTKGNLRVNLEALTDVMKVDVCAIGRSRGEDGWWDTRSLNLLRNPRLTVTIHDVSGLNPSCSAGPFTEADGCTQIFVSKNEAECWVNGTRKPPAKPLSLNEKNMLEIAVKLYGGSGHPTIAQTINPESCDRLSGAIKFTDPIRFFSAVETETAPPFTGRTQLAQVPDRTNPVAPTARAKTTAR